MEIKENIESTLNGEMKNCYSTLVAAASVHPRRDHLQQEIADAEAAQERGYYLPDEDERLRELFARFLEVRVALRDVVARMEPWVDRGGTMERGDRLKVFVIGFTAACYLVRSGLYMIEMAKGKKVVRKKLDEAEPRFSIPSKSFTEVYRLITSVPRMLKFHEAWMFYEEHREELYQLAEDSTFKPVIELLKVEEPFMEMRRRDFLKHRLRYRLHSFRRRNRSTFEQSMFRLFEIAGRTIAELRDPTVGLKKLPKRALGEPTQQVGEILEPGDIIITRHRDAMSNVFLPGFWPHGALYVGDLGEGEGNVMEAKKDGVLLRNLTETLTVDAFVVLRACLDADVRETAAQRSLTHRGKLYDFYFDFRQTHRLVCTALIYQSWHGLADVSFELGKKSGRMCLSAENLIQQALDSKKFGVAAYFGPDCEAVLQGEQAERVFLDDRERLKPS